MPDAIDLARLSEPFPASDVEWRVSRSGVGPKGTYCMVLAYITARAIQLRLDEVCGPANWRLEEPRMIDVSGKSAFSCGLSIRIDGEWITKWDVSEPTQIEPVKGGWSSAMKRAGAQWGIGRYLYHLDEKFAEVNKSAVEGSTAWNYARLSDKHGGDVFYWKAPKLPDWALPKEPEHEVSAEELNDLKRQWKAHMGDESPSELRESFERFVVATAEEFPVYDHTCWTKATLAKCQAKIGEWTESDGISNDVPFDTEA